MPMGLIEEPVMNTQNNNKIGSTNGWVNLVRQSHLLKELMLAAPVAADVVHKDWLKDSGKRSSS
jgi:hypothetical protein